MRSAPVESEREVVEVVVHVPRRRSALMGADDPPLEQPRHQVNVG